MGIILINQYQAIKMILQARKMSPVQIKHVNSGSVSAGDGLYVIWYKLFNI